jgi:hypothetical protein
LYKRLAFGLVALVMLGLWCWVYLLQQPAGLTVTSVLMHPEKYDQRQIQVHGTACAIRLKESRAGNAYTAFELVDDTSGARMHVFTFGHEPITPGQAVVVKGTFSLRKTVGAYTFRNEIDASDGIIEYKRERAPVGGVAMMD